MGVSNKRWIGNLYQLKTQIVVTMRRFEFLAPLMLRLYLAPIFIAVGLHKATHFGDIVSWFGNAEWGLGLPFPVVMAFLATVTEIGGGFCLLFGLANRLLSVPLMITMIIAIVTVHGEKGWFAIAPSDPEASVARVLAPIGFPGAEESLKNSAEVSKRLNRVRTILQRCGNYEWLTERGPVVVLNNGIEFAVTYFLMLLTIFFMGPGRFVSVDYWIDRWVANWARSG